MIKQRILVIDNKEIDSQNLRFNLEKNGYIVNVAANEEQIKESLIHVYSLVLIDVSIGKEIVVKFIDYFQKNKCITYVPIILSTARERISIDTKLYSVADYISRPYAMSEVLARMKAVLRREEQKRAEKDIIVYDNIRLNLKKYLCMIDGVDILLTKKEFSIFVFLLNHRGLIFTRQDIVNKVWVNKTVLEKTVDVNIARLRQKIGRYGVHLITRNGYGYGFEE